MLNVKNKKKKKQKKNLISLKFDDEKIIKWIGDEWIYFRCYVGSGRRITTSMTSKHLSSPTHCKTSIDAKENLFLAPPNTTLSKNQQSELTSYLSRRRNTTGSISINKIDPKNASNVNLFKSAAASALGSSNNKLSSERNSDLTFSTNMKIVCFLN